MVQAKLQLLKKYYIKYSNLEHMIYTIVIGPIPPQTIFDPHIAQNILMAIGVFLFAVHIIRKVGKGHEEMKNEEEEIFEKGKNR